MSYELFKNVAYQTFVGARIPSITGITRLETQPTAISLQAGLAAALADPLWLLSRQWQFNEFQGEDAGTPLRLAFQVQGVKVDAFRAGADRVAAWQPIIDHDVPIETRIEAEPAWSTHPRLRGEAGMHALRMASASVRAALLAAYPFTLAPPTDADADRAGLLWSTLLNSRTIDAIALAVELRPLLDADGKLTGLPAQISLGGVDADDAKTMLGKWIAWLDALLYEGDAAEPSWQRNRMEYAFALKAGDTKLEAAEYSDGHLDWEDFQATAAAPVEEPVRQTFAVTSRHPTPVRYPGMPAERFWEFEDGDVNFAGAEAGVTDLLRMSVTEFALTFGNDWFLVPVRLPVGWIHQVSDFVITDSFGVVSSANAISNADGTQWSMYSMTADVALQGRLQHALFLPDTLDGVIEGAVLEETTLARDEMANLAWAIEHTVQGVSGEPLDRGLEAHALAFQQRIAFDGGINSPQLVYRLQTPVPANWIPLLPVRDTPFRRADPLTIRLARAGMKRFYPEAITEVVGVVDPAYVDFLALLDAEVNFISGVDLGDGLRSYVFYPRGWMLRRDPLHPMADDDTLLIEEEEVPRIGATLKRKFQYARSSDGRTWLWVGRSKIAGRGGAQSALRFDVSQQTTATVLSEEVPVGNVEDGMPDEPKIAMPKEPRIIVKFHSGTGIPYIDSAHIALPKLVADSWQTLTNMFPGAILSLNRLISTQTGEDLQKLIDSARNFSGEEPPDLLSVMAIDVQGGVDIQELLKALNLLPFIEFAYEETQLIQPTVDPSDDTFSSFQAHLLVAPFGIDAFFAWNEPGSDGTNVGFVDIERGWNLAHEDLVGAGMSELNLSVPGNERHSTACLGIVLGQDNDKGIIGLAPKVKGAIASSLRPSLADAFTLSVGFLEAGDILLIEEQTVDGKPVEMDPHLALLIRTLTLLGIVVIEPAGNGFNGVGHDLNLQLRIDGTSLDRNTFNFFDTGAIMVGARHALLNRSRMPFSCFGNRVDCHSWGENIVTTSSIIGPSGPYMGLNSVGGEVGFGGTSGASAIVAGAAIVLQGIARNQGKPLFPSTMRALLSDSFNTPSDNPAIDQIGVMPNLREAISHI